MSIGARRELLASLRERYAGCGRREKGQVIDEFVATVGYNRKYAITLLNGHPPLAVKSSGPEQFGDPGSTGLPGEQGRIEKETGNKDTGDGKGSHIDGGKARRKPRLYDENVRELLVKIWKMSDRLCSKRLRPFLGEFMEVLERFDHIHPTPFEKSRLLQISSSTIDRLLKETRKKERRSIPTTKPGHLLKKSIPIRTFNDWDEKTPGFLQIDTVSHCGQSPYGTYLSTLTATDVAIAWTETWTLPGKYAEGVVEALELLEGRFPFPLLGLDSDNGSEFINQTVNSFCESRRLTFTRGRRCKKNDQCYVEQKNGDRVRPFMGHERYENSRALKIMNRMNPLISDFYNFLQPTMKLERKEPKDNGRKRKIYSEAKTPYRRLLAEGILGEARRKELERRYESLDPVRILEELKRLRTLQVEEADEPADNAIISEIKRLRRLNEKRLQETEGLICSKRYYRPVYYAKQHGAFDDFLKQVKAMIKADPEIIPEKILRRLQKKNPGRFCDYQLRTLRRRIKEIEAELKTEAEAKETAKENGGHGKKRPKQPQKPLRTEKTQKPRNSKKNRHRSAMMQHEATKCHG